jgi:hypothetical protein
VWFTPTRGADRRNIRIPDQERRCGSSLAWSPSFKAEHSLDLGKIVIYSDHGAGVIEGVTRSPVSLEGARSTFVIRNEGQHWLERNDARDGRRDRPQRGQVG